MNHVKITAVILIILLATIQCDEFISYAGDCQDSGDTFGFNLASSDLPDFDYEEYDDFGFSNLNLTTVQFKDVCIKYPFSIETIIRLEQALHLGTVEITITLDDKIKTYQVSTENWTKEGHSFEKYYQGETLFDLTDMYGNTSPDQYGNVHFTFKLSWIGLDQNMTPSEEFTALGGSIQMIVDFAQKKR